MATYRKKPVEIEAFHWGFESAPEWFHERLQSGAVQVNGPQCIIFTLEGMMTAQPGDWILKGVQGELYPCKGDIFAATYEAVSSLEKD